MGPFFKQFLMAFVYNYFIQKAMNIFCMFFLNIIFRAWGDGPIIEVLAT